MDRTGAPPRQARSRATEERIVVAALDLLGEKTFDEMTVADIATRAGVSVGGFYARFPGKDALLQHLNMTVIEGMVDHAREQLSLEATADLDVRDLIERFIQIVVRLFREHRSVVQQISLRSRTSTDPAFRERVAETNRLVHDLFRDRLERQLDEIGHPVPLRAIDIALTAVSGAAREYVLFQEHRPQFDPVHDDDLVAELTDLFCSYLRVKS
ncbi:MAG: TetR/AcrR family transcriptional regulator [Planctomycetota bacterium]|jgi:AcrR family transcriptional regulator